MKVNARTRGWARGGAVGWALLLPAAALAAGKAAAPGAGWSPSEAAALNKAAASARNTACYFQETPADCAAASEGPPVWLRDSLPSMRDCLLPGEVAASALWARSLADAAGFLHAAQESLSKAQKGKGTAPVSLGGALEKRREDLAARLESLESAGFAGSLEGRGVSVIGMLRETLERMDAAVAAAKAARDGDFRAAVLGVAWQAEDIHAAFAAPAPESSAAQPPVCVRLADFDANPPPNDAESLHRLARIGRIYEDRGDFAQAAKAYGFAVTVAQALGDSIRAQNLLAQEADADLELKDNDAMRARMAAALDLAKGRNDIYAERALLNGFLARLQTAGKAEDLQADYARRLSDIADRLAGAQEGLERGKALFGRFSFSAAKDAFLESAELGNPESWLRIGDCDDKLGNAALAGADYRKAADLARAQGGVGVEAEAYWNLARLDAGGTDASAAADDLESVLRLSLSPRASSELPAGLRWKLYGRRAALMASLEDLYNVSDQWERARRVFAELGAGAREGGDAQGAFLALVYLARAQVAGGLAGKGVESFTQALGVLGGGDSVGAEAAAFFYRSLFAVQPYWTPALREAALEADKRLAEYDARRARSLRAALASAKAQKDASRQITALLDLAGEDERNAALAPGRPLVEGGAQALSAARSRDAYSEAVDLAEGLKRPDLRVAALRGLGRVLLGLQDYEGALLALGRALSTHLWADGRPLAQADAAGTAVASAVALRLGDTELVADLMRQLAYAQLGRGQTLTAVTYFHDAMELESDGALSVKSLLEFAKRLDAARAGDAAVEFLGKLAADPRAQGDVRLQAAALVAMASVQSKAGGLGQDWALERLEQAYALLKPRGFEPGDMPMLLGLGELRLSAGKAPEAARAFEDALALEDSYRAALESEGARLAFTAQDPTRFETYRRALAGLAAASLKDSAYIGDAFQALERLRGHVLLEALAGVGLESESPLRLEETAVLQRIAMLVQRRVEGGWSLADAIAFSGLQDRLARLAEQLRAEDPHYASLRYPTAAGALRTQRVLKDGEVLVSYATAGASAWAFVLHASGPPRLYRLGAMAAGGFTPPDPARAGAYGAPRSRAREFGAALWDPFAGELAGARKALVVPDGDLWDVPFSVLETTRGAVVSQSYALQVLPSASLLVELREGPPRKKAPGALAAFAPLPGNGAGARALLAKFPKAEILFPPQATRDRAVQDSGGFDRVLFDSPCRADETRPWLSAVAFKGEDGRDESLTVSDAMRLMPLDRTDLVALGGCSPARAGLVRGEGFLGFARGFLFAGARATAGSSWRVPDAAQGDLLSGFFAGLDAGQDAAVALQAAQRSMAKRAYGKTAGSDPFYWGGYEVYGDP